MSGGYGTSTLRPRRRRSSPAEVEARREAICEIVADMQPMTVRQVFYQATVRGLVEKTEGGYRQVQQDLVKLREDDEIPYRWLTDGTRWRHQPDSYGSVEEALRDTARLYRKALWRDADDYVEFWLEKDALVGVVYPITSEYDVPLLVARGYASLTFLHESAEVLEEQDRPCFIYHLGDFDPSGVDAGHNIERRLQEYAPEAEIYFERIAVTPEQIKNWNLPTRPTKPSDPRAAQFGDTSVELDAIHPDQLRGLVRRQIELHLPREQMEILKVAERSERALIRGLVDNVTDE